ncbi:hypothetical protein [Streptomyces sp. NPDC058739]
MSLPRAARALKIPQVVRDDRESRGLALAVAPACCKKLVGGPGS